MINHINLVNYKNNNNNLNKWTYILDSDATNTAENFGNFKYWLENSNILKKEIYVITSSFHKNRAVKILNGIIPNNNFKWLLSHKDCNYCLHNEEIHSKNIKNDIQMGLKKYNQIK